MDAPGPPLFSVAANDLTNPNVIIDIVYERSRFYVLKLLAAHIIQYFRSGLSS